MIDQWKGPANTEFSYTADLGEGEHTIRMEYVEYGGDATAALELGRRPHPADLIPTERSTGTFRALLRSRAPPRTWRAMRRRSTTTGAQGSPGANISANRFVARWTRTMSFAPGDYEFAVTADDGVRLYVDGVRVIDKWIDQSPTTYRTTLPLDGGPHKIVMEYYENGGGAVARLGYTRVADPPPEAGYHAEYWNTPGATGPPSIPTGPADLVRDDETLDFDWGAGSPGAGIAADHFVARWTKTVTLSAGIYRFSGVRDDGIRAYIDNVPVVDRWASGNEAYSIDKVVRAANTCCGWSTSKEPATPELSSLTTGSVRWRPRRPLRRRVLRQPEPRRGHPS